MIIQERPLVLLGLSLLGHLVFTGELVFHLELYILCLEVVVPDLRPVGTVLPGACRKLFLLEFSEWNFI